MPVDAYSVEIWRLDLRDEQAAASHIEAEAKDWFDSVDRAVFDRRAASRARSSFAVGRWLMRRALARRLNMAERLIRFETTESGKPTNRHAAAEGVAFNLSHIDGQMIAAVGQAGAIGVDIEDRRRGRQAVRIAGHFFSRVERELLARLEEVDAEAHALRLWTLRESIVKAADTTIWDALGQVSVELAHDRIMLDPEPRFFRGENWWIAEGKLDPLTQMSLCVVGGSGRTASPVAIISGRDGVPSGSWTPSSSSASS